MASTSRPSVFPPPAEPPKRSSNSDADKNSACFCVGRQITSRPSTISGVGDNGLLRCNDDGFTDGRAELFAVLFEQAQVFHGIAYRFGFVERFDLAQGANMLAAFAT